MTTFAVTNSNQLLPAVNYLLSNLDTTGSGNVVLPGNVLVANTTTGVVSQSGNSTPFAYLYQYVNLRYSNNASGTAGFDTNSNNYSYFGVFNSTSSSPSTNPSAYQWYEVSPPFDLATSRTLYYSAIGGRQIQWVAASSPPSTGYQVTVANVAIDLDVVTTATGTPGDRGPIAVAFVITTADPNTATAAQLTTWFSSSRENITPPIGTGLTPVVGDTATFTYTGAPGNPSATLSYNGSIWIPVDGQVVNGNVIVTGTIAGNAIIANTITATQIATNTITANNIAGNTITGNKIAGNTITGNLIASNTITANNIAGNTITGNLIAGNTIVANNIQTGTLTTNLFTANSISANIIQANTFTANTISGQAIIANTFTANTINGTSIVSGSITTDKLAANVLTANTVISTGAIINNFNSPGFWLDGVTGNARFGNTVSIGNSLSVGNNASIGANLVVQGLITSGNLNANTVQTTTLIPLSTSVGIGSQALNQLVNNPPVSTQIFSNASANISIVTGGSGTLLFPTLTATVNFRIISGATPGSQQQLTVFLNLIDSFSTINTYGVNVVLNVGTGPYPRIQTETIQAPWISFFQSTAGGNFRMNTFINPLGGGPQFYTIPSLVLDGSINAQAFKR